MGFDTEKFTHEFPFIFRPSSEAAGKLLGLVTALEEQDISSPPDFFGWELVQTGDEDEPWIPESYHEVDFVYFLKKGEHRVAIVNEDKDSNIGEWTVCFAADTKEPLETIKKDLGLKSRIIKNGKVSVWM